MTEITGLPEGTRHNLSKDEIEEKSARLLVKLIRCPDAATREEVYRWIDECPAHAVAFAQAEAAWEAAERLKTGCGEWTKFASDDDRAQSRPAMTSPLRAVASEAKRRSS